MSASLPSSSSGRDGSHAGRSRAAGHAKRKESDLKMIVEESLVDSTWLSALKENFLTENEAFPNVDGINFEPNGTENPDTRRFRYQLFVTPLAGLIQWTRVQNSVRRQDALYSDVLNTLNSVSVIAANSAELCRRALLSSDDVTFIEVDEYLQKMIQNFEKHCKRPSDDSNISRVILLFTDLEKQITKAQKKITKEEHSDKIVAEIMDKVCIHVMLRYGVEVVRCKNASEASDYLLSLSRTLESQIERPLTEFNCVTKATRMKAADDLNQKDKEKFQLQQTWMAMMQMLPHVSKDRALSLISEPGCSSLKQIYERMNDRNVPQEERMLSLQTSFGGKRDKDGNVVSKQSKLSKQVFRLMTVTNPDISVLDVSVDEDGGQQQSGGTSSSVTVPSSSNGSRKSSQMTKRQRTSSINVHPASCSHSLQVGREDTATFG